MNSRGYKFYCPSHSTRIVEARNAKFLEDHELSRNEFPKNVGFHELREFRIISSRHVIISYQRNISELIKEEQIQEQPLNEAHVEPTTQT